MSRLLRDGTDSFAKGGKPCIADNWVHGVDVQLSGEVKDGGSNVRISGSSGSHIRSTIFGVTGFIFGKSPLFNITLQKSRNTEPRVSWTAIKPRK
jgi:hypothetical protein